MTDGVAPGAIVLATLAVGLTRWDRERCYVRQVVDRHGERVAAVVSIESPSVTASLPINGRSITVLHPSVPLADLAGGDLGGA